MKKNKIPFLLKVIQFVYPKVEKIVPRMAHRFFVTIFFSPLNYKVPPGEKALEKEAEKFCVRVAGKKVQCYSWGEGPVILLVHGWAGRATQFRKIIYALVRAHFRVVGFDGPAHGKSSGRSTDILEFEEALRVICQMIGQPEGIIAHSFGGGAVLFAAMNGLPVKKIINIATPTMADRIIDTYIKTVRASAATATYFKSYVLKATGKPFEHFTGMYFIRKMRPGISLLIIHDEQDQEVDIKQAEELVSVYPGAVLYKTRGLGHTRILKDERVIRQCVTFMAPERQNLNKVAS